MKLYTSYFYQLRHFPRNLVGLSTVMWPPKYINMDERDKRGVYCVNCPPLIPGKGCENLCDGSCTPPHPHNCTFLQKYYEQLSQIDWNGFCNSLQKLADRIKKNENLDSVDFAFIVFESPTKMCSERAIIQRWVREHGAEIQEWTNT